MSARTATVSSVVLAAALALPAAAAGQTSLSGAQISISRARGPIVIDGKLSDDGWKDAARIDTWYETQPGDNIEPPVKNVGYLTYDDRYLYAAFEFEDPHPELIRAPFGDHDDIGNGFDDYGGVVIDARNSGRTGTFFVVTPRNVQYDSVTDDASGEDSSPDYFWESATSIQPNGWTLEIKIPFSSLRYKNSDPATWAILLYRNFPREFHYQFFSARLPRGGNCFVCRANTLVGLERLPRGGHMVLAPYVSGLENAHATAGAGTPLVRDPFKQRIGADMKLTPNADNAVDLTVRPDFSQIESDTAQVSANERFALSFPEKRPFFLEGINLFATPIQAVYTRTITAPDWGARLTGKEHGFTYTALVADDRGGGSVVVPGPNGSELAPQDFSSRVFVGRVRREIGRSFVSVLATDRETSGFGDNRVVGPDFEWRPTGNDVLSGQWLHTSTVAPARPDLSTAWAGQTLESHAAQANFNHSTTHVDVSATYKDFGDGFRADTGFVPQVGYREGYVESGYTVHPNGFLSSVRFWANYDDQLDRQGGLIFRQVRPGVSVNGRWSSFFVLQYLHDRVRAADQVFPQREVVYFAQISPSRFLPQLVVQGDIGEDVDFANARQGHGGTVNASATINATNHLAVAVLGVRRWLNVDEGVQRDERLFTASIARVKTTYTFTARSFVRAIAQYVSTDNDPRLFRAPTTAATGTLNGSVLFAFKINWQSVMFVGYGDDRELTDTRRLEPVGHQVFVKASYAFQR